MQQNLIDAARAVIAADRDGELTDEHILALEAAAVVPDVQMMPVYRVQLKTRAQMKRDIPEGQRGWWYDVAHGETLTLRQATQADLDRCTLNDACSRSPSDYMCETFDRGSLVSKAAIAHITPEQHTFTAVGANQHPDDVAVDRFALAMKAKLADGRAQGRSGWDDPAKCSVEYLAQLLVVHLTKTKAGNFEDVANLAMMLHQRGADPSVLAEAAREKPAGEPVTEECQKAIRRVYVSLNSPIVAGRIYAKYNRKVIEAALEVLVQVHDQLASKEPKHD